MSYDDPGLSEFRGYFKAKEPGRRERAEAWATAIGLQKVDGMSVSRYLVETAKEHIEGRITQAQARRRIRFYEHAGAQMTNVRVWLFEVEYSILVLPCGGDGMLAQQDWAGEILGLYRQMLTPQAYARNVRLIRG